MIKLLIHYWSYIAYKTIYLCARADSKPKNILLYSIYERNGGILATTTALRNGNVDKSKQLARLLGFSLFRNAPRFSRQAVVVVVVGYAHSYFSVWAPLFRAFFPSPMHHHHLRTIIRLLYLCAHGECGQWRMYIAYHYICLFFRAALLRSFFFCKFAIHGICDHSRRVFV